MKLCFPVSASFGLKSPISIGFHWMLWLHWLSWFLLLPFRCSFHLKKKKSPLNIKFFPNLALSYSSLIKVKLLNVWVPFQLSFLIHISTHSCLVHHLSENVLNCSSVTSEFPTLSSAHTYFAHLTVGLVLKISLLGFCDSTLSWFSLCIADWSKSFMVSFTKSWLIGKDPDAGKDWRQKKKWAAEDEMVR